MHAMTPWAACKLYGLITHARPLVTTYWWGNVIERSAASLARKAGPKCWALILYGLHQLPERDTRTVSIVTITPCVASNSLTPQFSFWIPSNVGMVRVTIAKNSMGNPACCCCLHHSTNCRMTLWTFNKMFDIDIALALTTSWAISISPW